MQPRTERSRDLERVLTFVDAIAAVAITLLILPLVDLAGEIQSKDDSVADLITSHSGQFWSFGLSFAVIARLWVAQHQLMRPVSATSPAIVLWLLLWSFTIVFLPFPTALLPEGGDQQLTKILYIGTLAASSACLTAVAIAVRKDPSVRVLGQDVTVRPYAITAGVMVLALVITLVFPVTSYYPLLLLLTSDAIEGAWRRLNRRVRRQ